MRRFLVALASGSLALSALAAPAAAVGAKLVNCNAGAQLQPALDAAGPGDTIRIRGVCAGDYLVTQDLTLVGAGRSPRIGGDLSIRWSGPYPPAPLVGITVSLIGLRISGSLLIDWYSEMTIRDARMSGITMGPNSHVVIDDSRVADGAGIKVTGPLSRLVLHDTTVSGSSDNGITLGMQGTASLFDSTVRDNQGRGIQLFNGGLLLDHSMIRRNGQGGIGGGQYIEIRNGSRIIGNTSTSDGGGIQYGTAGLDTTLSIEDSVIRDNTAVGRGGGIFIPAGPAFLDNVVIRGNTAGTGGGGLFNDAGDLGQFTGVTFIDNTPDDCIGC